jgi:hypothetical protein
MKKKALTMANRKILLGAVILIGIVLALVWYSNSQGTSRNLSTAVTAIAPAHDVCRCACISDPTTHPPTAACVDDTVGSCDPNFDFYPAEACESRNGQSCQGYAAGTTIYGKFDYCHKVGVPGPAPTSSPTPTSVRAR